MHAWACVDKTHQNYSLLGPHNTHSTFSRSWGRRSRSDSDGYGNLVNSLAPEPLKEFELKLTQGLLPAGTPRTD